MNSFLFNLCAPRVIIELVKYFLWVYPVEHFNFVPFFPSPCLSLAETGKLETEVRTQLERAGEAKKKCLLWLNRTTKNFSSFRAEFKVCRCREARERVLAFVLVRGVCSMFAEGEIQGSDYGKRFPSKYNCGGPRSIEAHLCWFYGGGELVVLESLAQAEMETAFYSTS